MFWRADYTTDSGKIFYRVTLVAEEDLLPEIYKTSVVKGRGFCDLPKSVNPRHAIITKEDGSKGYIEYPFMPGTANWFSFWEQIRGNPLIIASEGAGEKAKTRRQK